MEWYIDFLSLSRGAVKVSEGGSTRGAIRYTDAMNPSPETFRIHLEAEPEGGYTVTVPALPGCVTWGKDHEEAVNKARECIAGYLEALAKAPPGDKSPGYKASAG
jgi:predicted RNase H-like HicB family nuclease